MIRVPRGGDVRAPSAAQAGSTMAIKVEVLAPGAVVPQGEQIDAVSAGKLQAGWSSPNYWTEKSSALHIYAGAMPLGLSQARLFAWLEARGERELNALYRDRLKLKVHALACGAHGAEGSRSRSTRQSSSRLCASGRSASPMCWQRSWA